MKQEIIVAFHIGRGMREMNFRELVSLNDIFEVNVITQSDRYKSIDLILWLEERTGMTFDKWI